MKLITEPATDPRDASDITAAESQLAHALNDWRERRKPVDSVVDCVLRLIVARERFVTATDRGPYDALQKIERLERALAESERLRALANDSCDSFMRRIEYLESLACQCGWCSDCLRRERGAGAKT